ncbi:Predicted ATP-dependent endonuclease of the OLD family, contains P-loop ATPase and TOPRIM domains [Roseovarius pacificus]|uniref:Predicted ATP-dependent endonuclease of the OLD family, contains P-loop ATPase and TOPRIM domains n=1 Tax=Roseovarius pacificus TaxID=337701 RepID=A0A1M7FUV2_9RHOB|nr:AAA family ATPase [Roseovarius pacificus]GGO59482.1 ATP-dependent endonuclease [Roseovarius pacificus]SHM07823.1 Predicted ATP-dependent endonuclease of the OLD family, contains P-loop ATPase and TOPRIM domains [Roseovarius pacificus]
MRISALEVVGLRSIEKANLTFDNVTVLIGGNNAGKSTLLHALRLFFEAAPKITPDDFHRRETESIEIIATFDQLTAGENEEFGSAVHDGKLTVSRTLSNEKENNLTYSVRAKTYPPFDAIRAETNKTNMRTAFNDIADATEGLDRASNAEQVAENMRQWEQDNPDKLEFSYVRGFFGAPNVANGKLKKKTSLHFIPAVADVQEETSDAKRSPIIGLLSEIAKQTYENREEVKNFIEKTQTDFDSLVSPDKFPQLGAISESLTSTIQKYYSDSRLLADWKSEEGVKFSFPQPAIKVEDSGFLSGLEHVGHGLQRAALFSVIEFLAQSQAATTEEEFDEAQSDIILLIEEPEIYQHPHKQKLVSAAFRYICEEFSKSTGIRFQVVFATHSEKFVDIEHFHTARIMRKTVFDGNVDHSISALTIRECSQFFANLVQKDPMPDHAFLAKLHIFSREICEGFFAQKVILVEGVTDKAILEGVYQSLNRDCIAEGIVIVSVEGKTKMDKPFYIFNKLGIPTYAVFDSDANSGDKKPGTNRLLQLIAGIEEPINYPSGCFARCAAFERNLEGYTKQICGDQWQQTFQEIADDMDLHVSDVCKTPQAVNRVVENLRAAGTKFPMFEDIVVKVDELIAW